MAKSLSIFDVAKAFLSISGMTHKKLQKLCYYAQAWYLALYDENLTDEHFEAWVHGPVSPTLYSRYKHKGWDEIEKLNNENVNQDLIPFINEIYRIYGGLSGDELEMLSHRESPWIEARGELKPWESSNDVISDESMKDYCRGVYESSTK